MTFPSTLGRLGRYVLTGGSAAVVDLGVFALLKSAGVSVPAAAACSFGLAAVWNYRLTSRFVFGQAPSGRRFAGFLVFAMAGLAVNVGVTVAAVDFTSIAPVEAKILGIGVAFLFNFTLNSLVVFRPGDATANQRVGLNGWPGRTHGARNVRDVRYLAVLRGPWESTLDTGGRTVPAPVTQAGRKPPAAPGAAPS